MQYQSHFVSWSQCMTFSLFQAVHSYSAGASSSISLPLVVLVAFCFVLLVVQASSLVSLFFPVQLPFHYRFFQ
ncbi:hypothetical protein PRUPE_5G013000 [Prunus persica]|uniref:Uncharacterized protein n=1 Tax=Prunus persica TaxID=3760 RepID=M5WW64_PRUPE|nr:hypothetical protein PRUPE_5G013000 [Prunus persica]